MSQPLLVIGDYLRTSGAGLLLARGLGRGPGGDDLVTVPGSAERGVPLGRGDGRQADQEGEHEDPAPDVVQAVVDLEDLHATQEECRDDRADDPGRGEHELVLERGAALGGVVVGVLDRLEVLVDHDARQDDEAQADEHGGGRHGSRSGVPDHDDDHEQQPVHELVEVQAPAGVLVAVPWGDVGQELVLGRVRDLLGHDVPLRGMEVHGCDAEFVRVVGI